MIRIILTTLVLILLMPMQMEARRHRRERAQRAETPLAVDVRDLTIRVDYMSPRRWNSRSVSAGYGVTLRGDEIEAHLPYMGVVHQPDFERDGLNFTLPISGLKWGIGKRGATVLALACRRGSVTYQWRITIWPNGKADIYLQPSNADGITYEGEVEGTNE